MSWYKNCISFFTLSMWLTLIRLVGSPLILPFFIVYLLPYNNHYCNAFVTLLFFCFCATDFFDGYFARRHGHVTFIGTALDPVADKFLLYSTLVALLAAGKLSFVWVIIMIGREFFVMGLRQIALEHSFSVSVSQLGKIKTAVASIALSFVIANPYHAEGFSAVHWYWNGVEFFLLSMAALLSLWSAKNYADFLIVHKNVLR